MKKLMMFLGLVTFCLLANMSYAGTVSAVTGDVDVMVGGSWTSAYVGMSISDGSKIMTGINSTMTVSTTGGAFSVSALSMVTFNEASSTSTSHQSLDLELGSVDVEFKKVEGLDSSFQVSTPRGTASIRGTREIVTFYPMSGMRVVVLLGEIDVSDLMGNTLPASQGQTVIVTDTGELWADNNGIYEYFGEVDELFEDENIEEVINDLLDVLLSPGGLLDMLGEPERI